MREVTHVITTIMRGGAENQLLEVVKQQVIKGWVVKVIFLKGEAELQGAFRSAGAEVISFLSNRNIVYQYYLLKKFFAKNNSIVHAHLPRAEIMCALANNKRKFIFTRHNAEKFFPSAPKVLSIILSRIVCKRALCGIAITHAVRKYLVSSYEVPSNYNLKVIHYGYTPQINLVGDSSSNVDLRVVNHIPIKLVTVGRLVPQKDQKTLLESVAHLINNNKEVELTIIGEGYLRGELEVLSVKLDIDKSVKFIGRLSNPLEEMLNHDVFILPSIYEGFGLVLLEAMDCGLPIIAANNTCIPEVIGNAGLLFETSSPTDLAAKILLCFDFELRKKLSKLSRARLEKFNSERMCDNLITAYEGIQT